MRELRQNLSVYLRRVKEGEALEVTEHGHVVARLVPAHEHTSVVDRLIAEGRLRRGEGRLDELPLPSGPITDAGSRALQELREDKV